MFCTSLLREKGVSQVCKVAQSLKEMLGEEAMHFYPKVF